METKIAYADEPDRRTCYLNGLLRLRAGHPAEASGLLLRALRDRPEDPDIRRNLVRALLASEQYGDVLDQAAIALAMMPDDAEMYFAQGTALTALHRPLAARAALTRAVVLRPNLAAAWLNLGNVCIDLEDYHEAERHYRTAIRLNPALAQAFASLGHLLLGQGRLAEATTACESAVRLAPGMAEAHWNLASVLLLAGDMPRGMLEYEWRKRHPAYRSDFPPLPGRYWSGGDPAGLVILVRAEQGFGDTIQFARYLLTLAERGATPVLLCDPVLVPLLSAMPGVVVLSRTARVEGYDAWIDLMSLPLVLGGMPFAEGYLRADSRRGTAASGFRVGIAWAGNPAQANDWRRSIPAAALAPLLAVPGVEFVNLQVGARAGEAGLPDLSAQLTDFAKTAALIATLDLVIGVDSAVAHLAGALGAPVWVLLAHVPDWRWLMERDDSPWYSSARLFRQGTQGDWDGAIRQVVEALGQKRSSP
jgi:predicted Zn-dependent protease